MVFQNNNNPASISSVDSIDISCKLIDTEINELKLIRWREWERNHDADTSVINLRIIQLKEQKKELIAKKMVR